MVCSSLLDTFLYCKRSKATQANCLQTTSTNHCETGTGSCGPRQAR
jgi:hypothetical protein